MGKKSAPPPAPDYTALAEKTAQGQQELLLQQTKTNRPTQNNPWGSVSWSQDGQGNWTQNVSLNPAEQAQLDANRNIQRGLTDTAGTLLGQAQQSISKPMTTEGLPAWYTPDQANLSPQGSTDKLAMGNIQSSFNAPGTGNLPAAGSADVLRQGARTYMPTTGAQTRLGDAGKMGELQGDYKSYGGMGAIPQSGDYGELGKVKGGSYGGGGISQSQLGNFGKLDYSNQNDLEHGFGAVKEVQDSMNALLAPGREQARQGEIQRLKSQGITEDSPAWTRAMQRLETGDMEAANRSLLAATGEYGNIFNRGMAENQHLAGLSQSQADLLDRQRGMRLNEQSTQAQLQEAQAQRAMQSDIAGAGLDSANQQQLFGQAVTGSQMADNQRLQNQQMDLANAGFNSANQNQRFNQNLASGQFANQGLQQQFGQNLAAGQFANQGMDQRFNQGLQQQQFQNQLRQQGQSEQQQGFNQAMQQAQFGNQAQQQGYNQSLQQQQLAQQLRAAGLDEQQLYQAMSQQQRGAMLSEQQVIRQSPLNDLRNLSGANPGNPTFQDFNAAGQGQGADYLGAGTQQYQSAMDAYNAKQARSSNMMSGLFGIAGSAMGGPMGGMLGSAIGGAMG